MIQPVLLHDALAQVCPIDGIALNEQGQVVRVDWRSEATPEQREIAQRVIDEWDWANIPAPLTPEERIESLEAEVAALKTTLGTNS
ncbi:MAG: hypothetical protein KDB68_05075 [Planctomycetes bacterium]|nr:hypothetical protein [Planctomycetota bacterium]MCA8946960.1 hypothetical protein [Planctomycetota bacterium]